MCCVFYLMRLKQEIPRALFFFSLLLLHLLLAETGELAGVY